MSERDPYAKKVAEESASFIGVLPEIMDAMTQALPADQRELFAKAVEEVKEGLTETQEQLRSGVVDDALVARKPPALWELEKHMFNEAARDLGVSEIEEFEEGDES
jgi:hypothetical protein